MLHWLITRFGIWLFRTLAGLRYRVETQGLRGLKRKLKKGKGTLFLPTHPAHVDPILLVTRLWPKYRARPMVAEHVFYLPAMHGIFENRLRAVPVPGFERASNSYKRMRSDAALEAIVEGLEKGENFVIYPSGRLKRTPDERVGGASLVHEAVRRVPDCNIVLVRTTGLWGSIFSWALTGRQPSLARGLKLGMNILLKHALFFAPKRKVKMEFKVAPDDLADVVDRRTFNKRLEAWYNEKGEESVILVPYNRFKPEFPKVNYRRPIHEVSIDDVPIAIRRKVTGEVARLARRKISDVRPEMHLFTDLGLDSLDIADLITSLEHEAGLKGQAWDVDLLTVGSIMAIVMGKMEQQDLEEPLPTPEEWRLDEQRPDPTPPEGETLIEAFLRRCDRNDQTIACGDDRLGVYTYRALKKRALTASRIIARMPGKHIGIMLPATVAAQILVLGCYLAGKVPVMVNWTIGTRYLEHVREVAGLETVLSSWAFLDQLDGADLTPLHDVLAPVEGFAASVGWRDIVLARRLSKRSAETVMGELNLNGIAGDDQAVILFTSGTEALPKGVPLSHANILANHRAALSTIPSLVGLSFLSVLPPFHSLGFCDTGMLPLVSGIPTVYFPDPTDAGGLVQQLERYRPNVFCSAPTFLKGLFASGRPDQLSSLKLIISGAEKAPPELLDAAASLDQECVFLEGYGITECAPILTLSVWGERPVGVGRPLPGVELLIVHPETHERQPQDQVGLILARGPNVFAGYLEKDLASPFVTIDGREWYNTGDLGSIDEAGNLILAGRLKRFVKVGGEMISLPALELALQEAAIEEHWGEGQQDRLIAIVAKEESGHRPRLHLFANYFIDVVEANEVLREKGFSSLARIHDSHHLPELPLMGTGKIDYRELQQGLK